jgi:hypothetical protein
VLALKGNTRLVSAFGTASSARTRATRGRRTSPIDVEMRRFVAAGGARSDGDQGARCRRSARHGRGRTIARSAAHQ